MKLALVHREVSERGGTERFVAGLATWLAARGDAVDLWCDAAVGTPADVGVRALGARGRGRIGRMWGLQRAAARIPRGDYDAVLGFCRVPGLDVYRAGGGCHAAWMDTAGWSAADAVERALDRRAVLSAGLVVANSRFAGAQLTDRYGLAADRLRVVHNGVDLARFRPGPAVEVHGRTVLFLGNGYARKGLETALRAVARLPEVHLTVGGSERRMGRYTRLAAALGLTERVRFIGPVDRPEALLPTAGALLLPTRYDPFANVVLEALAAGVPAVTSGENGAAEVLPAPWMAVTDPTDDEAFAAALDRALHEPGLRADCRAAAEAHPADGAFRAIRRVAEEQVG